MNKSIRKSLLGLSILSACAFTNAHATYTYTGCGTPSAPGCKNYTWNFDASNTTTGVATNGGPTGTPLVTSSATGWHANNTTSKMIQDTPLPGVTPYSGGLGVSTPDDFGTGSKSTTTYGGAHAIDNKNIVSSTGSSFTTTSSGIDLVIFSFDKPITLTEVTFGYVSGDADFQLFAYSGAGDNDADPLNNAFEYNNSDNETASDTSKGLTNLGWDLLGSYGSAPTSTPSVTNVSAQTAGKASKYWAIGAYSAAVSGGAVVGTLDGGDDAFKLLKLCGDLYTPPGGGGGGVPEPGTLSLLGLGLLGAGLRRRRAK